MFKKCAKYIRVDKKCELAKLKINFFDIDQIMTKLERKKLKIEIVWEIANELTRLKQSKLKRFREQKRFLKKREQIMFDKSLNNVKQLKRLKKLKKIDEIKRKIDEIFSLNKLFDSKKFFMNIFDWLT